MTKKPKKLPHRKKAQTWRATVCYGVLYGYGSVHECKNCKWIWVREVLAKGRRDK